MRLRALLPLPILLLLSLAARADFIAGQVVDPSGVGVPGVDIDAVNLLTGEAAILFNDGTDPNGFFLTTIPAGIYQVTFNPPPPPTTTHLVLHVQPVTVVGTNDMGVVGLLPGVSLGGHVQNTAGFPVANVNLDVFDKVLGTTIDILNGFTDGFGNFLIAVPANAIELRLDATPVIGQTLVSRTLAVSPTSNSSIPDVVLQPGLLITGNVLDDRLRPLKNADIDVIDSATRVKLYTPGDDTDDLGDFSVVAPAGTWDVEICPPSGKLLVATDVENLALTADTDLGTFPLQAGVFLTGTVTSPSGAPVAGVDLDVESVLGGSVVLCQDETNAQGQFSVIVPTGTFDVIYSPPFSKPLGQLTITPVAVAGNKVQNASLPACPFGKSLGGGRAGAGGVVPHLGTTGGAPRAGNRAWALRLEGGLGGGTAFLALALADLNAPLLGGASSTGLRGAATSTRLPGLSGPLFLVALPLGGASGTPGTGSATVSLPVPLASLVGETLVGQFAVPDPAALLGLSLSDALRVRFCL